MKVAFDYQIFSSQTYGGISRYFSELARNIPDVSSQRCAVRIIAPLHKNQYLKSSVNKSAVSGFYVREIPRAGRIIRGINSLLSPVALQHFAPDIIHETYYSAKKMGGKKFKRLITVYDMIHEKFPQDFSKNDKTRDLKKIAVSRADHIICISENTRKDLINLLNVNPEKTSTVHLGFSLSGDRGNLGRVERKSFLLYVGSRGGYKNFVGMVEAFARSPKLVNSFEIVAFGGGPFSPRELSLFKNLRLPSNCISQVDGDDTILARLYQSAALFVYPSLYEGFGIPPLEAMSYGCPIACSHAGSIPEVVGDAAFFFDPSSLDSISESLENALFDSEARESLAEKSTNRIHRYSWTACADATWAVYQKVFR